MARRRDAHPANASGDLFVDTSCIDCGTCSNWLPTVFAPTNGQRVVVRQPDPDELAAAHQAVVACPVTAIGSDDGAATRAAAAIGPVPVAEGVRWCGYTNEATFGATAWLIERVAGNVLVDVPRPAKPLRQGIEALGGVALMVLSHRDDIAGHETWARWLGAERVAHVDEAIEGVERTICGDEPVALAADLLLIPSPGHTRGSCCLLSGGALFTGDHLWWNPELGALSASRSHCWFDWPTQRCSLERLLDHPWSAVYPGHGASHRFASVDAAHAALRAALTRLG